MNSLSHRAVFLSILFANPLVASADMMERTSWHMGTSVEIKAWIDPTQSDAAKDAFDAALAEITRIEKMMSEWRPDSDLTHVNQMAGKEKVVIPRELFNVIEAAQKISQLSDGAFDITWAGMWGLWNFKEGQSRVPTQQEIDERLPLVDYRNVELDAAARTVFLKKPGMAIGLGAIAKGYAIDKAMQILLNNGVNNVIVRAGGDMRIQGTKQNEPWDIGIRHPRKEKKHLVKLKLSNISLSTSGDYERYFIDKDILYHHIIDPKTGFPARACQSVSILAPDTMTSDALSTAVFVLGPERGLKLIERLPGVQALIVDANGVVHRSSGFKAKN